VRQQRPELQIKPGEFYDGVDDYSIRVEGKDPETNMLYNLHIYDHSGRKGNISVTVADSGLMKMTSDERELIITLYHGTSYNEMQEERRGSRNRTYPEEMDKFGEQRFIIPLTGFGLQRTDENLFKSNYQMMNLSQLNKMQDSLQTDMNGNRKRFEKVLYINNLFKVRNYRPPIKHKLPKVNLAKQKIANAIGHKTDTLENEAQIINLDTILNKLEGSTKRRLVTQALMNARSTKIFIEDSKNNYIFQKKHLRRYQIEWHRKFTISFACFIFLFIGAPLGAIIRKGGLGMPLVLSTLLFIFYYITSMMGEKFVRESILPDYEGMWLSSFILLIIGIFLTFKATTDSRIFNIESYRNLLKRLISFFINKSYKKENSINDINPV
jgi:lipopolysaccharide export system permease protein